MFKKLSGSILIYTSTNVIKSLVPFLMLPILTIYLNSNEYGLLSIIEVTIIFLFPLISLNISGAINVEYHHLNKNELNAYITNSLMLSFFSFGIIFILFLILNKEISSLFDVNSSLVLWLPVFALLRVATQVILGLYQISQKPKKFAYLTIFQTLMDFSLSYLLIVYFKEGYMGRLEGVYFTFFLFSVLAFYLLLKMNLLGDFTMKYSKEILLFGLPLIPHAISGAIMAMSDRYFISYYIGNEEVGFYTVAYQLASLMLLVSISVNQAWTPILYSLLKLKKSMNTILLYSFGLAILFVGVGCTIYVLQEFLFKLLIDEKFYQAKEFFEWLLYGFVFQSFYFLATNFLFYEKKTVLLAKITFVGAILNILLNYFYIQKFGTIGVAYATAITWVFYSIAVILANIIYYKKASLL